MTEIINPERYGRFTSSEIYKLFVGGKGATRSTYILQRAIERIQNYPVGFVGTKHTEHGNFYEWEAIQKFVEVTGFEVEDRAQQFIPHGVSGGSTPDGFVMNKYDVFRDDKPKVIATLDAKCPTTKFWEQKLMMIEDSHPDYQNVPKQYYWQGQHQMLVASDYLGYTVEHHYLFRYLTNPNADEWGNSQQYEMDDDLRYFWAKLERNEADQQKLIEAIEAATIERDELILKLSKSIKP